MESVIYNDNLGSVHYGQGEGIWEEGGGGAAKISQPILIGGGGGGLFFSESYI